MCTRNLATVLFTFAFAGKNSNQRETEGKVQEKKNSKGNFELPIKNNIRKARAARRRGDQRQWSRESKIELLAKSLI